MEKSQTAATLTFPRKSKLFKSADFSREKWWSGVCTLFPGKADALGAAHFSVEKRFVNKLFFQIKNCNDFGDFFRRQQATYRKR